MKIITGLGLLLLATVYSVHSQENPFLNKNILEIYESLPVRLFNNNGFEYKYLLTRKSGEWFTQSSADYEMPVIVDIANGYIEISDEGTGGGSNFIQVVLFRKMDKTPCVGITLGGFNGIFFESHTQFYEAENGKWSVVTENVFPEIKFANFLNAKFAETQLQKENKLYSFLDYWIRLPQHGLTVELGVNMEKIQALIREKVNFLNGEPFDEEQNDLLFELVRNIGYEKILLRWDKEKGTFNFQEKIPMPFEQIEEMLQGQP